MSQMHPENGPSRCLAAWQRNGRLDQRSQPDFSQNNFLQQESASEQRGSSGVADRSAPQNRRLLQHPGQSGRPTEGPTQWLREKICETFPKKCREPSGRRKSRGTQRSDRHLSNPKKKK